MLYINYTENELCQVHVSERAKYTSFMPLGTVLPVAVPQPPSHSAFFLLMANSKTWSLDWPCCLMVMLQ